MQYALLIYTEEPTEEPPAEAMAKELDAYDVFTRHIRDRGAMLAGEALQPVTTATTIRQKDGDRLTTDGPFAETKEGLGGFYLIEAKDLDEALELAGKLPAIEYGASIEVRPIWETASMEAPAEAQPAGAAS